MPTVSPILSRFTMGEISPLLAGRVDLARYPAAMKKLENFIPLLQGPLTRRGGTRFVTQAGNGAYPVALIDFAYSETTTYIIEAGAGYLRFFYQRAPVLAGGGIYQVASPWAQSDLFNADGVCLLKWVQSGDVMYIVCPGKSPYKLSRYGHTDWRLEPLPGWNADKARPNATAVALWRERLCLAAGQTLCLSQSGAFENFQLTRKGLGWVSISTAPNWPLVVSGDEVSTTRNGLTITWTFMPGQALFNGLDQYTVQVSPADPSVNITRFTVTLSADSMKFEPDVLQGQLAIRDKDNNGLALTAFEPGKADIDSGGTSLIYNVDSAGIPVAADDPIEINVYSEQMDRIEWLCPGDKLLVGTSGGEFMVGEITTVDPLGPENIKVVPRTSFGSSPIQAFRVGAVVLFVQRAARRVREFVLGDGEDYVANDLTPAAEHVTRGGVTAMVWQSEPIETLWLARGDGQLIGFTYSKEQEMHAWHRHILGGGGAVTHLAVVPARHGGKDDLWLSVRRLINGQTVHYLEIMEWALESGENPAEAFYLDCGQTFRGNALTVLDGLGHLEGCEVGILGDGGTVANQLVSGGRVSLPQAADLVQVGLPYESKMSTVSLEIQMPDGSIQGRKKRIIRVVLRLIDSAGGWAGKDGVMVEELNFRRAADPLDRATPLFSGDHVLNWPVGYDDQSEITIVCKDPLPFTLAAIIPDLAVEGKS